MRTRWIGLAFLLSCSGPDGPPGAAEGPAAPEQAMAVAPAAGSKATVRREPQRHTVPAGDGHPLAVWSKSPAQPRGSIVLLHGRTWSGRPDFDLQVEGEQRSTMDALVAEGLAAYALDLRGHGGTKRDDTGWLTPNQAEADLTAVLRFVAKRHDGEPPALLGWSLGALTSQLAAQRHPGLVSALILYGYPRSPDHAYAPGGIGPKAKPARKKTTAAAAAEDFIVPGAISKAAIAAFVEQALAADPVKSDWRAVEEWAELDPAKVAVPTMVIHGARDPYAPVANQAKLFARLGHADRQWVIVAGGDHAAHLENVGPRFIHALTTFLRRP